MAYPPLLDTSAHALFLDFDGTLVGFRDDPAAVRLDPETQAVLTTLSARLSGALAVVSGRRIADLDRLLAPLRFAAAGVHGLEMRPAPGEIVSIFSAPEELDELRATLRRTLAAVPGLELEDKGTALVLHFRRHPELETQAAAMMREAIGDAGLVLMEGNGIVEVHLEGMDKGRAVSILSSGGPFAGRRPVYVGDDTTDEFAFRVMREAGGVSIKVGPGETAAEFRLEDVAAVHAWLAAAVIGDDAGRAA